MNKEEELEWEKRQNEVLEKHLADQLLEKSGFDFDLAITLILSAAAITACITSVLARTSGYVW